MGAIDFLEVGKFSTMFNARGMESQFLRKPSLEASMLDATFVSLLACPETKQSLRVASQVLVDAVNAAIERGEIVNRASRKLEQPVETLLVREDNEIAYPVWDGMPTLLIDEGICVSQFVNQLSKADGSR